VPGLDDATFQEQAKAAKDGCIISRALAGVGNITVDATLES
jgi:osmotically inducible protein OsmC